MPVQKTMKLSSGQDIPTVGLGTWKSPPGQVTEAVEVALAAGYRHLDCAFAYRNEHEVGSGLLASIKKGVVRREDVFITSKLWNTYHRPDLVRKNVEETLKNLQTDYLDLYLIHWPMGYKEDGDMFPKDADGKFLYSNVDYLDTWKSMEQLVRDGLVRNIGLSNFNHKQIQRVIDNSEIKPIMLQIEVHAYLPNRKLIDFCHSKGITVTAYSPLGSPDRPWAKPEDPNLLAHPKLTQLAEKLKKTNAQVLLRWLLQRNLIVIPKSVTAERIRSNIEVYDFDLSNEEMQVVDSLDVNFRGCALDAVRDHPHHPFHEEY